MNNHPSVRPDPSLNSGLKVLSLPVRRSSFKRRRIEGSKIFSNIIHIQKIKFTSHFFFTSNVFATVRYPSTSSGRTGERSVLAFTPEPDEGSGRTVGRSVKLKQIWSKIIVALSLLSLTSLHAINPDRPVSLSNEASMKFKKFYENKSVLVTGGCGFIGSHIAEHLVKWGARVTIIDDLSTGFESNLANFKDKVTFFKESIVDPAACDRAMAGNEIVFHTAAFVSVPGSVKDPESCHKRNIDGTFNLLQAARKHSVKRFVFSSTSSVYGVRDDVCFETDTDLQPVSPYGATKLMAELYCKQFSFLFNVPCVMLRYFNVYGPRQDPHSAYAAAVAKFKYRMERNEPITIFGDGKQTRDFVHVQDVLEANLLVGMAPQKLVDGQSYNIGTGKSISVIELAEKMKPTFPDYTAQPQFMPARNGDVRHTKMSAVKFRKLKEKIFE